MFGYIALSTYHTRRICLIAYLPFYSNDKQNVLATTTTLLLFMQNNFRERMDNRSITDIDAFICIMFCFLCKSYTERFGHLSVRQMAVIYEHDSWEKIQYFNTVLRI